MKLHLTYRLFPTSAEGKKLALCKFVATFAPEGAEYLKSVSITYRSAFLPQYSGPVIDVLGFAPALPPWTRRYALPLFLALPGIPVAFHTRTGMVGYDDTWQNDDYLILLAEGIIPLSERSRDVELREERGDGSLRCIGARASAVAPFLRAGGALVWSEEPGPGAGAREVRHTLTQPGRELFLYERGRSVGGEPAERQEATSSLLETLVAQERLELARFSFDLPASYREAGA